MVCALRVLKETPKTSGKSQKIFFRPFGEKVILPRFRRKSPQRKTHRFPEARVFRRLLKIASVVGLDRSTQGRFSFYVPKSTVVLKSAKSNKVGLVLKTIIENAFTVGLVRFSCGFLRTSIPKIRSAQLYVASQHVAFL